MHRRIPVALAATAALGVSALAIAPAIAAPKKNQIVIRDGSSFKPGFWVRDNMRFTPFKQTVRSGATVTVVNKGPKGEPHSISFVKKSQLPKTIKALNRCEIPKDVCLKIAMAHQVDIQTGSVGKPVVDVNKPGVDGPGDSLFIPPGQGVKFKVTAKKGTTLYFMCAVHPWMQGSIKVR